VLNSRITEPFANYVRGLLMGGADIIPGVSGGTVALIVGIYERLIHSIKLVFGAVLALLGGRLDDFRSNLAGVEWLLIVPLFAGIATALLVGAAVIPGLMKRYPVEMRALFFGLIAGSLVIPWRRMGHRAARLMVLAVVAAVVAFVLVGLPPRDAIQPALWIVFFMAAVAICAMILPGVSGAFLLLVFGIYEPTLDAIHNRDLLYIAVFGAGAAVGLGSFSGVLNWLLEHRHDSTMAVLIGLMAGSLRALWPWTTLDRALLLPESLTGAAVPLVLIAVGVAFVLVLAFAGQKQIGAARSN
jgi:putative membrane protein